MTDDAIAIRRKSPLVSVLSLSRRLGRVSQAYEDHHDPVRRESLQIHISDPGYISSRNTGQALRLPDTQAFLIKILHDCSGQT